MVLSPNRSPTKRAADFWESAASSNIFLASGFFCSQAFSQPAQNPLTQTVGPYVILTPTNAAAGRINQAYLNALQAKAHTFKATTTGDFNTSAFPTETDLTLKVGAKVILLRNDSEKRWVNGSVARIAKLSDTAVWIDIGGVEYEVEPVSWENRRYAYDVGEQKIVETVAGTFKQFPLRLAWALTHDVIHERYDRHGFETNRQAAVSESV